MEDKLIIVSTIMHSLRIAYYRIANYTTHTLYSTFTVILCLERLWYNIEVHITLLEGAGVVV